MEKNKKENTNNLISRIKARANADKNTEEKKSPNSLILRKSSNISVEISTNRKEHKGKKTKTAKVVKEVDKDDEE